MVATVAAAPQARLLVSGLGSLSGHDPIRRFYQEHVDRFAFLEVDIVGAFEDDDQAEPAAPDAERTT